MSSPRSTRSREVIARIDGASRGNPGPAAFAVIFETADGKPLTAFSKYLAQTTNNVAEYQALLAALDYALEHHCPRLRILSDSELLVRQTEGSYKVKSAGLKPLYECARQMIERLESFSIQHVPREQNREADRLANRALDSAAGRQPRDTRRPGPSEPIKATATYQAGTLVLQSELPLAEGEEVEVEIRPKETPTD